MLMSQSCVAPFSMRGLVDHVVELIISEDNAFHLLNKPTFCKLLHYLHPTLAMKDIPHCTKIYEEVLACTVQAKSKLKAMLQVCHMFLYHMKC